MGVAAVGVAAGVWWFSQRAPDPVVAPPTKTAVVDERPAAPPEPPPREPPPAPPTSSEPDPVEDATDPSSGRAAEPVASPAIDPPAIEPRALEVSPRDATVTVDGEVASPSALRLDPKGATVVVRRSGYGTRTIRVDASHPLPSRIELAPLKPAAEGYLQVFAAGVDWAEVAVDGRKAGATPTRRISLPSGSHRVTVTCTDACPTRQVLLQRNVTIRAGETTTLHAK